MTTNEFSKAATGVIATVGSTAHQIIDAYRAGGERINEAFTQRWNAALKESAPQLKPETRKNAAHALGGQLLDDGFLDGRGHGQQLVDAGAARVAGLVAGQAADRAPALRDRVGLAALRAHIVSPLQTLANLVAALREDDFSIRGHSSTAGDPLEHIAHPPPRGSGLLSEGLIGTR